MQYRYPEGSWEDEGEKKKKKQRERIEFFEDIEKYYEKKRRQDLKRAAKEIGILLTMVDIEEKAAERAREFLTEIQREIDLEEKPSFAATEEWLKEIVIDPSFFMFKLRSDRLLHLLERLEPATVIVPTDFYNILSARYRREGIIENIEEEQYYPRLLDIIRQWEIPIPVERQKILNWISSADFWGLLSKFFERKVTPASEYLRDESRFNPIDNQPIKKVLGETVGQVFYEMIAVSERLKRAIISATYGFVRLCRRIKIPTYQSYTEWKDSFRKKCKVRGDFLIIVALAAGGALGAVLRRYLPTPIAEAASGYVTIKIYDG